MSDEDCARFITSMREFNVVEPIGSLYEKGFRDKKHEFLGAKSPIGDLAPKFAPGGMPDYWQYSSYLDYVGIGKRDGKLCNKEIILSQFGNREEYADFMDRTGDCFKDKKEMEKYLLE